MYILTIANGWNDDYVRVFKTVNKLAKAISEDFLDEGVVFLVEDIKQQIQEREKNGYLYLFDPTELDNSIKEESVCGSYTVRACVIE